MNIALDEMFWDVFWTLVESGCICFLGRVFAGRRVSFWHDALFVGVLTILAEILTFAQVHTMIKFPVTMLLAAVAFRLIYRMDVLVGCMIYACFGIGQVLAELNVSALPHLLEVPFLNEEGGAFYYQAYLYLPVHILSILFVLFLRNILADVRQVLSRKMAGGMALVMLGAIFLFLLIGMNLGAFDGVYEIMVTLTSLFVVALVFLSLKFFANSVMTRAEKEREEFQLRELQARYQYYDDRLREEERVRSIYHDMKNHLLVLESGEHTAETRKMAQELRAQIADYEDYVHTGNEFLDIIIKDKAEKARKKEIDFSAFIDFGDVEFIEPLDISTIFENGIDNAIEACEKLPREERMITVKAGKVRDFVSILIENSCSNEVHADGHTTKQDKFIHGLGISNMKKAAEKYNGSCTTRQGNGKFTLKILLPAPESDSAPGVFR